MVPFYYTSDIYYLIILIPIMILASVAQAKVKSNFRKYSQICSLRGISGVDAARMVLKYNGVTDVNINRINGELTDNYNPKDNTINLSDPVCNSTGIAAIGVAAHEAGHAVQYAQGYAPVKLRTAIIPITQFGSKLAWPVLIIGLFLNMFNLFIIGIVLFSFSTFFQLVTLPVEFNASRRALNALTECNMLTDEELVGAKKVLTSAAMTYVAALAVSLVQLLRFVLIALSRNNRRR